MTAPLVFEDIVLRDGSERRVSLDVPAHRTVSIVGEDDSGACAPTADSIPIQTRMMTIADIFDALTASDRPYKRAVPVPRALDIMNHEVDDGMLDSDLFSLFIDAKVFERSHDDQ